MLEYFIDPVLRGPTIGSMLMCLAAALVGVLVFLRRESLIGEALAHTAYPGVVLGALLASPLINGHDEGIVIAVAVIIGALCSACLGMWFITWMQRSCGVRSDSALCFSLAAFFGIGITIASRVQFTHTTLYLKMQAYLYGQPATMTDAHIYIYLALVTAVIAVVLLLYKELQVLVFDRQYAGSLGINVALIDNIAFGLVVLAVVVGIRSVGVVLMSAMLVAPAAAARQMTHRMSLMLWLSGVIGLISGFFGNYLSVEAPKWISDCYPSCHLVLPTGPMIVMVAVTCCIAALLFAPERGLFMRLWRAARFRYRCLGENVLKTLWRQGGSEHPVSLDDLRRWQSISKPYLRYILLRLSANGWTVREGAGHRLTADGTMRAAKIIRLHRLWELYLTEYVGMGVERVHHSAEEMEHIITPEIEDQLTQLLRDPKQDPHHQPIPPKEETS